ncbi:MAG: hypothetical protein HY746_05555 [Elusimicrobia bacterium]|nr:hypothetical protein [Elusimicrobiota bacterium]
MGAIFVKWYQEKDKVSQTAQNYLIKNSDKGWVDWVIGACISWVVEKICDTVWDAAKQKYVEVCKEAKTCTQYEYKPSSDDAQITPDEQYEIDNNLQRINVK